MEKVNAGGKERPYHMSYKALKSITKNADAKEASIESLERAAYAAFYSGHQKENGNSQPDFQLKDMEDWFDDDLDLVFKIKTDIEKLTGKITGETTTPSQD